MTMELLDDEILDNVVGGTMTSTTLTKENAQEYLEKKVEFSYLNDNGSSHTHGIVKNISFDDNDKPILTIERTVKMMPREGAKIIYVKRTFVFSNISNFQVEL